MRPYAANDLSIGALRSSSWIRTLAVFRTLARAEAEDPRIRRWNVDVANAQLDAEVRREFAIELEPRELTLADDHADFFTRGWLVLLVEVRALVLRIPNPFPELVPFPRLLRLERALSRARARLRALASRIR